MNKTLQEACSLRSRRIVEQDIRLGMTCEVLLVWWASVFDKIEICVPFCVDLYILLGFTQPLLTYDPTLGYREEITRIVREGIAVHQRSMELEFI